MTVTSQPTAGSCSGIGSVFDWHAFTDQVASDLPGQGNTKLFPGDFDTAGKYHRGSEQTNSGKQLARQEWLRNCHDLRRQVPILPLIGRTAPARCGPVPLPARPV